MAQREVIKVRLTRQSYYNIRKCRGVYDRLFEIAQGLALIANAQRDHPEQGELFLAVRSDNWRIGSSACAVVPANARSIADDHADQILVRSIYGSLL